MTKGIIFLFIVDIICPKIAATLSFTYSFNLVFPALDLRAFKFWTNGDAIFKAIMNVVKIRRYDDLFGLRFGRWLVWTAFWWVAI